MTARQLDDHLQRAAGRARGCAALAGGATVEEVAGAAVEVAADGAGCGRAARLATATGAEAGALEHERGVGDGPAVVDAADARVGGHARVGEEHLVEQGPSGHLPQRPHVDAGLEHLEGEVADPLVLGHVGVGAGEQHAEVGHLATRRPHLLAVDHPLVAVALGAGAEPGEVRSGPGLAEELAPRPWRR